MSKTNLKLVRETRKWFMVERSRYNMVDFTINNWRKLHHKPMRRTIQQKRVRLSSKTAKHR